MKALKSPRAKVLLADPAAKHRFLVYVTERKPPEGQRGGSITIRSNDGRVLEIVTPVIVPKAA